MVTDRRRAARLVAVLLAVAALLAPASAVRGVTTFATFGQTEAKATFNQSIDFSVPFTSTARAARVEIRLRFPHSIGPFIADVPAPTATGASTLHYSLDLTADGHLVPNTALQVTWAAYDAAGDEPVVSDAFTFRYLDTTHAWQTISGDIVTMHWYQGSDAFARHELAIGEEAVRKAETLLGVSEGRVDFYIYPDAASFGAAMGPGSNESAVGKAYPNTRTMFAQIDPGQTGDPLIAVVVPHELTHLVFDTAVSNPFRYPPTWLNEGVAVYLSEGYAADRRATIQDAIASSDLIPLSAITGQLPSGGNRGYLAETEGDSAVEYLVRTYGQATLAKLVVAYKAGLTDDEAFTEALGMNVGTFEQGWLADLGAQAPTQYGPQPNPSGPLPPGWDASPGASARPGASATAGAPATPAGPDESAATAAPTPAPGSDSSGGGDITLILLAIILVSGAMLAGLVLAGRRAAAP
jgi:hypothetical protein